MHRRLVLVRHAESAPDRSRPAAEWGLSERGRSQAGELVESLACLGPAVMAAGPEPRMRETLEPLAQHLGVGVTVEEGLTESHAGGWLDAAAFGATVESFFAEPDAAPAPGWEPARHAARRFVGAVHRLWDDPDGDAVVCSGGRVITAGLCQMGALSWSEAHAAWRALEMPQVVVVELGLRGWRRSAGSW